MGMRRARARARDERGVALVEFALVFPLMLLLIVGAVEFGKAFFYWLDMSQLANTGARMAVVDRWPGCTTQTAACADTPPATPTTECGQVNPTTPRECTLQLYLRHQANTTDLVASTTVTVCFVGKNPPDANVGDAVRVTVSTPYNWLPFLNWGGGSVTNVTLRSSATMRLEQKPTRLTGVQCPGT